MLTLPVIANSFLHTLYNLTDTYWLGRLGTEALAAINLVTPVQNIVINFGGGLTTAASVLMAQYVGANRRKDAAALLSQVFTCAIGFALVCAGLISALTPALVSWLGADGEVARQAVSYLRVVILDMPFLFTVNLFQALRQSQGDTLRPMLVNVFGILVNLALDPLLMVVFRLGAFGAGLATVLAKAVPAAIAFWLMIKPDSDIRLRRDMMRPTAPNVRQILRIGLPTSLGGSAMQFGFLLMSRSVFAYGSSAMAAYGIGNKINGLISLPSNGIGSATAIIVGQNMGAGQPRRAEKGYLMAMASAVAFLLVGGIILSRPAVSEAMVRVFSNEEDVVAMAADFLSLMAFWCFTNGVYNCTTGLFHGTGHTEITMLSDASRLWVYRFATLYVCAELLHLGVRSVWLSVVVSNGIAAAVLLVLYLCGLWKKNRVK